MDIHSLEKDIGGYIGRLLRENFGRGPGAVYCTLADPYISVHITNFLSPMEKSLMGSQQSVFVEKTRDLLMETLIPDIKSYIELNVGKKVVEFYYDWNLEDQTGAFIMIVAHSDDSLLQNSYQNKEKIHSEIIQMSAEAQKPPGRIYSALLNPRVLIVVREAILVQIEKELIQIGFQEQLKIAKRSLEKKVINEHRPNFERYLKTKIEDVFVDWNFSKDKAYTLCILKN